VLVGQKHDLIGSHKVEALENWITGLGILVKHRTKQSEHYEEDIKGLMSARSTGRLLPQKMYPTIAKTALKRIVAGLSGKAHLFAIFRSP